MTKKKLAVIVSLIAIVATACLTAASWNASTKTLTVANGDSFKVTCTADALTLTSVDAKNVNGSCASTTTTTTAPPTTTTTIPPTTTTTTSPPPPPTYVQPSQTGPRPGHAPSDVTVNGVRTISDSVITGSGEWALYTRGATVVVQYSDVSGSYNTADLWGDNLTVDHSNIHGFTSDAFKLGSNSKITNNWIHDCEPSAGAHADGVQMQDGITNSVISGNYIDMGPNICNSALFIAPDIGPSTNGPLTITNNYLDGGNNTVYIVDGGNGKYTVGNITFSGNRFGRNHRYGPTDVNVPVAWSDNSYLDNGEVILP